MTPVTQAEKQESLSPDRIMRTAMGFWHAKTLLSAVSLGLFTELAGGPKDLDALRKSLKLHERGARDFLDALTAMGFLRREDGKYANAPDAAAFLIKGRPGYIGGILEMADARLYPFWGSLTEALRTGEPQNEVKTGGDLFDELYNDPARLKTFLQAMTGISLGAARAMAEKFPWEDYKTFADVGCAQGALPVEIARNHPHLHGTGFDLAVVRPVFEEYVKASGFDRRVAFVPGDFFKDPFPAADVIVMGHILHDWNLEQKRVLIQKAYEALPKGGALIAYEALIDDDRSQNAFGLLMSLNMLIETRGGFDYTGADASRWMKEAGFSETRVEHLVGPDSMVIGVK